MAEEAEDSMRGPVLDKTRKTIIIGNSMLNYALNTLKGVSLKSNTMVAAA